MARPGYLLQPTVQRLPTILKEIEQGQLLIPRFQRPFEWKDEQRLKLLDSIEKGMPIGSLLVWRTKGHKLATYRHLGPFALPEPPEGEIYSYLLDGHQRLSTLYGALHEVNLGDAGSDLADDEVRWPIFYDLESSAAVEEGGDGDSPFRLPPKRGEPPVTWLPLSKLFNPASLYEHQKSLIDVGMKELAKKAESLANNFKDYQIPTIPIVTEDLRRATESFQRINSQGTAMSEVHMVNALLWTEEFDLNQRLRDIAGQLGAIGWGSIDPQVLLDVFKVTRDLDVYKASPERLKDEINKDPGALDALREHLSAAAKFLADRCGVRGPAVLPYRYQLILIADAARINGGALDGDVAEALRRWFWVTTYAEYFTGMTNTQIRRAVVHVRGIVTEGADPIPKGMPIEVSPMQRFDFKMVRGRAFALRLAEQLHPEHIDFGSTSRAGDLLAEFGTEAVPKILPGQLIHERDADTEGPENRWVIHPKAARQTLEDLVAGQTSLIRGDDAKNHVIPQEAMSSLRRGDYRGFLRARRCAIHSLEKSFVESLGLTWVEDP